MLTNTRVTFNVKGAGRCQGVVVGRTDDGKYLVRHLSGSGKTVRPYKGSQLTRK